MYDRSYELRNITHHTDFVRFLFFVFLLFRESYSLFTHTHVLIIIFFFVLWYMIICINAQPQDIIFFSP